MRQEKNIYRIYPFSSRRQTPIVSQTIDQFYPMNKIPISSASNRRNSFGLAKKHIKVRLHTQKKKIWH